MKKIAVLYIKHTCTRTINLQFFLQDPPVFYQEKRTNIATENIFLFFFFYFYFFFFFFFFLSFGITCILWRRFDVKERRNPGKGLFDSTAEYRFLKVVMGNIN